MKNFKLVFLALVVTTQLCYGYQLQDSVKRQTSIGLSLGVGFPDGVLGGVDVDFNWIRVGGFISRFKSGDGFLAFDERGHKIEISFPFLYKIENRVFDPALKLGYLNRIDRFGDASSDKLFGILLSLGMRVEGGFSFMCDVGGYRSFYRSFKMEEVKQPYARNTRDNNSLPNVSVRFRYSIN
jgi:hypothetical protein